MSAPSFVELRKRIDSLPARHRTRYQAALSIAVSLPFDQGKAAIETLSRRVLRAEYLCSRMLTRHARHA